MLSGKKTYIVALVGVISAVASYLTGDVTLAETLQLAFTAILGATLRSGIGKVGM